ncbi:MAG: DNA mismatch repair endonuclease MutL [Porphyromonadaceae bacterium]|nr:MAG: DNA mismatch repair endonuclease MutL [Porphyromonadaceae bacterium]
MAELIKVLPDSVANQIAAGEVIQRPASAVKELMENSVDSGADRIQVIIKDAGRTLVQVVDNGSGMSDTDARLCFERHATSKIRQADDLFTIRTMGFRGEALAAIAAVAQIELRTKTIGSEAGTRVKINGSEFELQEPAACPDGTSISVKNLYYNVPARRKFLKANSTELKHIITEFQRIALAHHDTTFLLHHNDSEVYNLPAARLPERIQHLFGKTMAQQLVNLKTDTSMMGISGYIGKPEFARKTYGEQFFFVNGRFMKHPYFHKAVTQCYDDLIPGDSVPAYFIFIETDPARIDVNIHPTKTEIKFEDERAVYQIIQASVREALGKFNLTPTLDFDREGAMEIPYFRPGQMVNPPTIRVNQDFNPFDSNDQPWNHDSRTGFQPRQAQVTGWEQLYTPSQNQDQPGLTGLSQDTRASLQLKNKYILIPVKSGIMVVNQVRAYERILFEDFMHNMNEPGGVRQQVLFPFTFELNPVDLNLLLDVSDELTAIGFDIQPFGGQSVIMSSVPASVDASDPKALIEGLLEQLKNETPDLAGQYSEQVAKTAARVSSLSFIRALHDEEVKVLIDRLFACREPQFTPGGKPVLTILQMEEIEKRFA